MPGPRPKVRKTQGLHNLGKGGNPNAHYLHIGRLILAADMAGVS